MTTPKRMAVLTCAAAVMASSSGCGFPTGLATPDEPAAVTYTPIPTTPPAPEPVEVAAASLTGGTAFSGSVRVTRSAVTVGPPPLPGSVTADCALSDDGSVRTLALELGFADTSGQGMSGLALDVTLTAADGGPPRPGTAVLAGSSVPGARWCQGTATPTTEGIGTGPGVGGAATVVVYVVARDAAPTSDLVVRLDRLRNEAGSNATGPWDGVTVASGACADDASALCVPLG